ncbi:MAG: phosphate signaling complex protein PhoU [Acidimicrobiales bacterium]
MTDADLRIEFHESLDELRDDIVRLGALTVETIGKGTAAMLDRDLQAAQRLIDGDDLIDTLAIGIEESCYRILALQQPMARDLRFIVCSLRLASELERSADLMVNICKASRRIYDVTMSPTVRSLIEDMSIEAASLTRKAIDSFVESDDGMASALDDIDDRLDDLQVEFIEAVFSSHEDARLELRSAVQLALVGRYYERIGDHAVNMGERITFMVTGWLPEHAAVARLELKNRRGSPDGMG